MGAMGGAGGQLVVELKGLPQGGGGSPTTPKNRHGSCGEEERQRSSRMDLNLLYQCCELRRRSYKVLFSNQKSYISAVGRIDKERVDHHVFVLGKSGLAEDIFTVTLLEDALVVD